MNKLDTNHNGYIDYTEFLAGCMKSKIYMKEDNLKRAFQYFDKVTYFHFSYHTQQDKNGRISIQELKQVLSSDKLSISEAEIEKLVGEVDANKDKQIDYSEFLEMMKNDLKVLMATYKMSLTDLIVFRPQCSIF